MRTRARSTRTASRAGVVTPRDESDSHESSTRKPMRFDKPQSTKPQLTHEETKELPSQSCPWPPLSKHIGAHVSASGGCVNAVRAAIQLGPLARSFAFFIRPRLSWKPVPPIPDDMVERFRSALKNEANGQFPDDKIVVHGSYLLNFGSHDQELRRKSVELMVEEIHKCQQLGIQWYVFHPGASTGHPHTKSKAKNRKKRAHEDANSDAEEEATETAREQSIAHVAECLIEVLTRTEQVVVVLETMCGQGNTLGRDFAELRTMLDAVMAHSSSTSTMKSRLGVCLDTCHVFASGWKLSTEADCEAMMTALDSTMGGDWPGVLKVVHVNDSRDPVGSRRDRHANIGRGRMGRIVWEWLMTSPRFQGLPMILETPREKKTSKKRRNTGDGDENEVSESKKRKKDATTIPDKCPSARQELDFLFSLHE